jgi:tRNA A64-2'-O-ribosylphosphate transferase
MPDALSKTIPIWCCVLNRLLFPDNLESHKLHTPPQVVSESEHAQITSLLPTHFMALETLHIPLKELKAQLSKPLRPVWVTPDSHLMKMTEIYSDYHPVICCTVSRRVPGGEISEGGYIQGAGDDTENWAYGLTPLIFWANRDLLLSTSDYEIPDLIDVLIERAISTSSSQSARCVKPTSCLYITALPITSLESPDINTCAITLLAINTEASTWLISPTRLDVGLGPHKLGSRSLRAALPAIVSFVNNFLQLPKSDHPIRNDKRIIIACDSGKDLSIGVALTLLCLLFDDEGNLQDSRNGKSTMIDKNFIKRRLGWISTSMPDVNPNRTTLQSVNSFLMDRR